jgi:hypothetical protein
MTSQSQPKTDDAMTPIKAAAEPSREALMNAIDSPTVAAVAARFKNDPGRPVPKHGSGCVSV